MKKSMVVCAHLLYWFVYLLLVSFIILAFPHNRQAEAFGWLGRVLFLSPLGLSALVPAVAGFYSFYYLLFHRFLQLRKIGPLVGVGLLTALGTGLLTDIVLSVLFGSKILFADHWVSFIGITILTGFIGLVNGLLGLVMKGFVQWFADITLREELNRKNYEMELALIKARISPHFLFNTLNNIDVLITRDGEKASSYLNKLSDILRFMLYEAKPDKIELAKELSHIQSYVALQSMRTANQDFTRFNISGVAGHRMIEPMLFIPFVENAYTHAGNKKTGIAIDISFVIEPDKIVFTCTNTCTATKSELDDHDGGLGHELIRRRLQLLYPQKHTLNVVHTQDIYEVVLILNT